MLFGIAGIGLISSIGLCYKETLDNLKGSSCGIRLPNQQTHYRYDVPVGDVSLSNQELQQRVHTDNKAVHSRTALLSYVAFQEAVTHAQTIIDATPSDRIAVISATTVGGMDCSPLFYKEYIKDTSKGRLRNIVGHPCHSHLSLLSEGKFKECYHSDISTACSSSANTIATGCRLIAAGLADVVICGGTDALSSYTIDGFKSLMIYDKELCRPLSSDRTGLNLGEAAGYIVIASDDYLKNLKADTSQMIYIKGDGNACDAYHQTALSPDACGPTMAMQKALSKAGLTPDGIDYIHMHGTGTANNDSTELHAIRNIFGASAPSFSSTKGHTGHTLAAAGVLGVIFSYMAIESQSAWGTLRLTSPMDSECGHPPLSKNTPMRINNVISNAFGFGGNCTSIIIGKL
ncbi:MAG: beta-ketoacyl-[acyl-carrier-protein] synthase family protein [Marinilabiliaceae bacterium]|nr:beta-ketoacyl-[acyl-carrier-protein] synthase family protein [Marinilabiliaceae bacterium]